MKNVNINREKLLEILKENKSAHETEYDDALSDYIEAVKIILTANINIAENGDPAYFDELEQLPHKPRTYVADYERSIRMLELSDDKIINLDVHEFNQLVLDEWMWKNDFTVLNSTYKSIQM